MRYSIGDFAERTGLSIHTLRYYEQERLLRPERDAGNRRRYSEGDLAWVEFIKRLKETGMPLREIRRYAELRAEGAATMPERLEMLLEHRRTLAARLEQLQGHAARLEDKIEFYREAIAQERPVRDADAP